MTSSQLVDYLQSGSGSLASGVITGVRTGAEVLTGVLLTLLLTIILLANWAMKNVEKYRETNRRAGLLMFQETGIQGKYPGLAEAIDKVLADQVGLAVVPLDAEKRKRAIDALRAIAWACGGGHG